MSENHRSRAPESHAPGPWSTRRSPLNPWWNVVDSNGREIADVWNDPNRPKLVAYNARLLAAAPDLLALAKQYASECGECGGCGYYALEEQKPCEDCADIRAVIARAEGREHG